MKCNGESVFDWAERVATLHELESYGACVLNENLKAWLKKERPEYCYCDDLGWLLDGDDVAVELESAFISYYSSIRAFHGCRPEVIDSYWANGLIGQNHELLAQRFRKTFSEFTAEVLDLAIEKGMAEFANEVGKIYFVDNLQELMTQSGHYIRYGPEYLFSYAKHLPGISEWEIKKRFRAVGRPTIFEVNIPIAKIPSIQIANLCKCLLADWGNAVLEIREKRSGQVYIIRSSLQASCIVGHTILE